MNEELAKTSKLESIQWKQLWSLASLYGSIIIGWIAYENYQPKLLAQFQFTDFSFLLYVVQGFILLVTPIYAGKLGDKFRFNNGHRLPIISSGISFAAMIFMALAFTLFSSPGEVIKWILPILIVAWLVAMSIFTSPALSTLELFTPVEKLPKAMAVLTIVANLIYSLEPVIVDIIDYLGAPVTFMAGGIITFLSGYALRKNSLGLFKLNGGNEAKPMASFQLDSQRSQYRSIFFMGIVLGLATTILFNIFPDILEKSLGALLNGMEGNIILVLVLVLSAIISLPLSAKVSQYGLQQSFNVSAVISLLTMTLILIFPATWMVAIMILIFSFSFTVLSVSSLPLAIQKANYYEKVFCVGIFFSGVALPDGIIEAVLAY
ncbi:MAG: MFS transporter [Cyclobacteriaceae bacterium]|nr:MFS transporter [Cyclobacteriaceae bacterium]